MKIIVYKWNGFNENLLENKLKELGHNVVGFVRKCVDYNTDMNLAMELMEVIRNNNSEAVISYDFFPIVAVACNVMQVKYYSWIYDCPHNTLYSNAIKYNTNRIASFDKALVDKMQPHIGEGQIFFLPLPVDTKDCEDRIRKGKSSEKAINSDVSFIGSLYTDARKNTYYDDFKNSEDLSDGEIAAKWNKYDEIIERQCFDKKTDLLTNNGEIDYKYFEGYLNKLEISLGQDYFIKMKDIVVADILERKVTSLERIKLMGKLSEYGQAGNRKINLFTNSDTSGYPEIDQINKGPVNYDLQMPYIFNNSKINIHLTLRSIHTGIPLRVVDILGCGGFLLCDKQDEILEFLKDEEDIVTFSDDKDCIKKIDYYLNHEDERAQIAKNGREKARELFSYEVLIPKLLEK